MGWVLVRGTPLPKGVEFGEGPCPEREKIDFFIEFVDSRVGLFYRTSL